MYDCMNTSYPSFMAQNSMNPDRGLIPYEMCLYKFAGIIYSVICRVNKKYNFSVDHILKQKTYATAAQSHHLNGLKVETSEM